MAKKLSRREFINLAALGAACIGSEVLLSSCETTPESVVHTATRTLPPVRDSASIDYIGEARGVKPGRVVWAHNPDATSWDGVNGFWWAPENINQSIVDDMVRQSLCQLTGQERETHAWAKLFEYFNQRHGKSSAGYQPGEKIALKINLNTVVSYQLDANNTFSAPHIIFSLLKQLVDSAGVDPNDIVVYDAVRVIPDCVFEYCRISGLEGVHFADFNGGKGREQCTPDMQITVNWSKDVEGSTTYLPTCVTQADYLINLAGLKAHNLAGVTLCAKNHCGTILAALDNQPTMQSPQGANIHGYIAAKDFDSGPSWRWKKRPMGSYNALVDMMGHRHLGEKTLLFIIEGLYAAPHQQATITNTSRWQSAPFHDDWTSSLFMSLDGVAIDSVGYDFLVNEPTIAGNPDVMPTGHTAENYLHEAAQADAPLSGTVYCPDSENQPATSLGVHEHWDNAATKLYSRNRGDGMGIELVTIS